MTNTTRGKRRANLTLTFCLASGLLVAAHTATAQNPTSAASTTWGIAAPWDARSVASVRGRASRLDAVVTGWIQLDSLTGTPSLPYPDNAARAVGAARRMALVTSYQGKRFHPEMIERLAVDPVALARTAGRVADLIATGGYRGIVLDIEEQSRADLPLTLKVVAAITDSTRSRGASTIAIALPAADTAAYPTRAFLPYVDFVMIMLVDEHRATSGPGPVASPDWVRRMLAQRVEDVGAKRVIAALPLYGYLWRRNQRAVTLSFNDARHAAAEAGVDLARDPASESLHAVQPNEWELWTTDADLLRVLRTNVMSLGVTRFALWWLGLEDPAVWNVFTR